MAEVVADRLLGGAASLPRHRRRDQAEALRRRGRELRRRVRHAPPDALEVVYADPARGLYQKIVVTDDAKTLLGGMFVGDAAPVHLAAPAARPRTARRARRVPRRRGRRGAAGGDLPDDAPLCSCNNVTVGTVRAAVAGRPTASHGDACTDLGDLKTCTRAGTQCGSCVPLVKKILETELSKAGIAVSRALCEHFALSRSELFESVRILELTSFERDPRALRHRLRLRHLQARRRLDPRQPALRLHPRRRPRRPAGHQRPRARQHAARRHLLGRAAHPGRRDHARRSSR